MKTLYLVRHAKSSWDFPNLGDMDRPLNKRGERDAPFMGKLIAKKAICPDVLMSSPAIRAYSTAQVFAQELKTPVEQIIINPNIYEASVESLLEIVQDLEEEWQTAMLFGHNMTYTSFVNLYVEPPLGNVPTCGIVGIEFDVNHWSEITNINGKVVLFEFPKKYFSKN